MRKLAVLLQSSLAVASRLSLRSDPLAIGNSVARSIGGVFEPMSSQLLAMRRLDAMESQVERPNAADSTLEEQMNEARAALTTSESEQKRALSRVATADALVTTAEQLQVDSFQPASFLSRNAEQSDETHNVDPGRERPSAPQATHHRTEPKDYTEPDRRRIYAHNLLKAEDAFREAIKQLQAGLWDDNVAYQDIAKVEAETQSESSDQCGKDVPAQQNIAALHHRADRVASNLEDMTIHLSGVESRLKALPTPENFETDESIETLSEGDVIEEDDPQLAVENSESELKSSQD